MRHLLLFPALLFLSLPVSAASPLPPVGGGKDGEVTRQPICANLINRSVVNIQGSIALMPQVLPDGTPQQYSDIFKLSPNEKKEICASGPFYEGRRIELTIRTLIPLFSCKTSLQRDIYLDMTEDYDGVKKYSATCH